MVKHFFDSSVSRENLIKWIMGGPWMEVPTEPWTQKVHVFERDGILYAETWGQMKLNPTKRCGGMIPTSAGLNQVIG